MPACFGSYSVFPLYNSAFFLLLTSLPFLLHACLLLGLPAVCAYSFSLLLSPSPLLQSLPALTMPLMLHVCLLVCKNCTRHACCWQHGRKVSFPTIPVSLPQGQNRQTGMGFAPRPNMCMLVLPCTSLLYLFERRLSGNSACACPAWAFCACPITCRLETDSQKTVCRD